VDRKGRCTEDRIELSLANIGMVIYIYKEIQDKEKEKNERGRNKERERERREKTEEGRVKEGGGSKQFQYAINRSDLVDFFSRVMMELQQTLFTTCRNTSQIRHRRSLMDTNSRRSKSVNQSVAL
jgi:hypothetical protein